MLKFSFLYQKASKYYYGAFYLKFPIGSITFKWNFTHIIPVPFSHSVQSHFDVKRKRNLNYTELIAYISLLGLGMLK